MKYRTITVVSLLVAAVAIGIQIFAGAEYPTIPPGAVVLVTLAALTVGVRAWWILAVPAACSLVLLVGAVATPNARDNLGAGAALAGGTVVQLAAIVIALVAALLGLVRERRGVRPAAGDAIRRPSTERRLVPPTQGASAEVATHSDTTRTNKYARAAGIGLVLAAVGDAGPEIIQSGSLVAGYDGPGPVIYLGFAALLLTLRWRFTPLLAVALSVIFLFGGFADADFANRLVAPDRTVEFLASWLQVLGFTATAGFGIAAVWPPPRRSVASA